MDKYNPKNRAEALSYQIEDTAKQLRSMALIGDRRGVDNCIAMLHAQIQNFRSAERKEKR